MIKFVVLVLWFGVFFIPASAGSSEQIDSDSHSKPSKLNDDTTVLVEMNFQDVDIRDFVSYVSELTGTNFVLDPSVKGSVTTMAPEKVPINEVSSFFQSVLEIHGYTIVEAGSVVKIIPSAKARGKSIDTKVKEEPRKAQDKLATQVIHLNYLSPTDAKSLLTPLASENSVIISYPQSGSLIITDTHSNIQRLKQIIKALDVPVTQKNIEVLGE
jgi:general secretion pathway protein D